MLFGIQPMKKWWTVCSLCQVIKLVNLKEFGSEEYSLVTRENSVITITWEVLQCLRPWGMFKR
ncbi:hypothetical protein Hdeb2414_s0003g00114141 [Helianthus debilis subsp. tardiflorus]